MRCAAPTDRMLRSKLALRVGLQASLPAVRRLPSPSPQLGSLCSLRLRLCPLLRGNPPSHSWLQKNDRWQPWRLAVRHGCHLSFFCSHEWTARSPCPRGKWPLAVPLQARRGEAAATQALSAAARITSGPPPACAPRQPAPAAAAAAAPAGAPDTFHLRALDSNPLILLARPGYGASGRAAAAALGQRGGPPGPACSHYEANWEAPGDRGGAQPLGRLAAGGRHVGSATCGSQRLWRLGFGG